MIWFTCHDHGEECWFADVDDQECAGRFARYLFEEAFGSDAFGSDAFGSDSFGSDSFRSDGDAPAVRSGRRPS